MLTGGTYSGTRSPQRQARGRRRATGQKQRPGSGWDSEPQIPSSGESMPGFDLGVDLKTLQPACSQPRMCVRSLHTQLWLASSEAGSPKARLASSQILSLPHMTWSWLLCSLQLISTSLPWNGSCYSHRWGPQTQPGGARAGGLPRSQGDFEVHTARSRFQERHKTVQRLNPIRT